MSTASYNAGNQLTQWGSSSLTYDLNGNLTSDGVNTYTWNARNQLVSMGGPGVSASFQYDGVGRRWRKTVNGVTTDFLYDDKNVVQELSGGAPTANLLTGLGLDEVFARTDSAGIRAFYTDGLGSTVALVDSAGNIQTEYTYEPFGRTTTAGASNGNPFQYTGRENDGTGLFYYRARYYSAALGRFVSEDPIGLRGGINFFAYAADNPLLFTDPLGLNPRPPGCDAECGGPPPKMPIDDAIRCCQTEKDMPPISGGSPYGKNETAFGFYRDCMFYVAGDNPWANRTRGCLACIRERQPEDADPKSVGKAYKFCWDYGFKKASRFWKLAGPAQVALSNWLCATPETRRSIIY